jgi:chromosome segregation ATPase
LAAAPPPPAVRGEYDFLRKRLVEFRCRHDALLAERDAHAAEAVRLAGELSVLGSLQDETLRALDEVRLRLNETSGALDETRQQLNDLSRVHDETREQLIETSRALDEALRVSVEQRYRAEQAEAMAVSAQAECNAQRQRADAIETSAFWRATAIPRRLVHRLKFRVSPRVEAP